MSICQYLEKRSSMLNAIVITSLCFVVVAGCSRRPPPPPPLDPGLHVLETSAIEDNGSIRFTVRLEPSRDEAVTVQYETVQLAGSDPNVIAVQNNDYTADAGLLTFQPGEISKVVSVPVNGDAVYEYDEKLSLRIFGAEGANVVTSRADGTIINDDAIPVATLAIDTVVDLVESDLSARTLTVQMDSLSALDTPLVIKHGTDVLKAVLNIDYSITDPYGNKLLDGAVLTIPAGESQVVLSLNSIDDGDKEADENISLELGLVASASNDIRLGSPSERKVTIKIIDEDLRLHGIVLNDTGIDLSPTNAVEEDAVFGFDATDADSTDGQRGFKFTKYASYPDVTVAAATEYATTAWNCVKDERTGLLWEVKQDTSVTENPRRGNRKFYWYFDNIFSNAQQSGLSNLNQGVDGENETCTGGSLHTSTCSSTYYASIANDIALCGMTGWRLPTTDELRGLVMLGSTPIYNGGITNDAIKIDQRFFPNSDQSSPLMHFWTSESSASEPVKAVAIDFLNGQDIAVNKTDATAARSRGYVRLVNDKAITQAGSHQGAEPTAAAICDVPNQAGNYMRAQTATDRFTFADFGGTKNVVIDNMTGLMWDRCPLGSSWDSVAGSCDNTNIISKVWSEALDQVSIQNALPSAGYLGASNWHLPDMKQLSSIVERKCVGSSVNKEVFPDTPAGAGFWSSTYFPTDTAKAFEHSTSSGLIEPAAKTDLRYMRLVRETTP